MNKAMLFTILVLLAAGSASADSTYDFTVNTATINGTVGYLDFQFNPGPSSTQSANMTLTSFSTDGTLGDCSAGCGTGDVGGTLPGTLAFDNGTSFNDYFTDFTFGSTLSFDLTFSGPAVNSPDGTSSSGSSFSFFMYDGSLNPLLTDSAGGTAAMVDINLDGSTTLNSSSDQVAVTPEPSTFVLYGLGLLLMGGLLVRQKLHRSI